MTNKKKIEDIKFGASVSNQFHSRAVEMNKSELDFLIDQAEKLNKIERLMNKDKKSETPMGKEQFYELVQDILNSEYDECSICEDTEKELVSCCNCEQEVCSDCYEKVQSFNDKPLCHTCKELNYEQGINII